MSQFPSDFLKNRDWLQQRYIIERLSCDAIGAIIGCDQAYVHKWVIKHGIPTRRPWETNCGRKYKPNQTQLEAIRRVAQERRGVKRTERTKARLRASLTAYNATEVAKQRREVSSASQKAYYQTHPEACDRLRQLGKEKTPRGCHSPHWKGGTSFTRLKSHLIADRGRLCQIEGCTWSITLDVHHLDGDRRNNQLGNLMLACPNHHSAITHGFLENPSWILRGNGVPGYN